MGVVGALVRRGVASFLEKDARLPMVRVTKRLAIGYAIAFIVYSVLLRNLPWPPFTWFYVPDLTP